MTYSLCMLIFMVLWLILPSTLTSRHTSAAAYWAWFAFIGFWHHPQLSLSSWKWVLMDTLVKQWACAYWKQCPVTITAGKRQTFYNGNIHFPAAEREPFLEMVHFGERDVSTCLEHTFLAALLKYATDQKY